MSFFRELEMVRTSGTEQVNGLSSIQTETFRSRLWRFRLFVIGDK